MSIRPIRIFLPRNFTQADMDRIKNNSKLEYQPQQLTAQPKPTGMNPKQQPNIPEDMDGVVDLLNKNINNPDINFNF